MPTGCVAFLVTLGIGPVLDEHHRAVPETTTPGNDIPVFETFEEVRRLAPPTEIPERPTLVRHRVRPRERLTQIAVRYGVFREHLGQWNKTLDLEAEYPEGHRHLKVRARRLPPPRMKIRYIVQPGDSWMDIAAKFRISHRDLHAYNWNLRTLVPGHPITLWVDPGWPQTIHPEQGPFVPDHFEIPAGALSVGRPDRGRLYDGLLLPPSELYTRKTQTSGLYGSSHTIEQLQRAFAQFRYASGFHGEIVIGAISRRRGGRFEPHRSHQSGRDIDIRLPLWPGLASQGDPRVDEIDWYATWELIEAFIDTGQIAVIFLDVERHRYVYEAARTMGRSPQSLRDVIPWPRFAPNTRPIIRHSPGHDTHIHVRIQCGPEEPRCRNR